MNIDNIKAYKTKLLDVYENKGFDEATNSITFAMTDDVEKESLKTIV